MTQRDDTELQTHSDAAFQTLFDAVANHEGHNTLALVVLDNGNHVSGIVRLAQNDCDTGDVAGNQGHTQGTDDGVGDEADAGVVLIGVCIVQILKALNDFRTNRSGKTGVQGLAQILLVGNQALENTDAGAQIAQGFDLYAGSSVNCGEVVSGIGEGKFLIGTVLCNGFVHCAFGKAGNSVGAAIDQIG